MYDFSKMRSYLEMQTECGIPALECAVSVDGEVVFNECFGYSDTEKTKKAAHDDLYWIFSASKVITCACAMRLVEEGRISLDDPVSKYLPEYATLFVKQKDGSAVRAQNEMKIIHLFTMSSGLDYASLHHPHVKAAAEKCNGRTRDVVASFAELPLQFEPGTSYLYSLSHDVLAAVAEVASGRRFSDYVKEILLDPLGIKDLGIHPTEEQKSRISAMYSYENGTMRTKPMKNENNFAIGEEYESGGACFFASVREYTKVITTLALGGTSPDGYRFLKPETVELMRHNRLPDAGLNVFNATRLYGYGWGLCGRVHTDPRRSLSLSPVGEFGWDGAAGALAMVDTENRVALHLLTHIRGCQYIYRRVHPRLINMVYEVLFS